MTRLRLLLILVLFASCQKESQYGNVLLSVKVLLQGPYDSATMTMRKDWNQNGMITGNQPFNQPPFNYFGGEYIATDNINIVDWVLVELREENGTIAGRSACFVLHDGKTIDMYGRPLVQVSINSLEHVFHVAVRHVNHLGIRTKYPIDFDNWPMPPIVDFTFDGGTCFQNRTYPSTIQVGAKFLMRAGDANGDGKIKRTNPNNDDAFIQSRLGLSGYRTGADINMDSKVDTTDQHWLRHGILQGSLSEIYFEQLQ